MSTSVPKAPTVPVVIRMPATQRDQLREIIAQDGYLTLSSWLRALAVRELAKKRQEAATHAPTGQN